MSSQTGNKNCTCSVSNQNSNCVEHARNLSAAANYMMTTDPTIEMVPPKRVIRSHSRGREDSDPLLEYRDPYEDRINRSRAYSRVGQPSNQTSPIMMNHHSPMISEGEDWQNVETLSSDINRLTIGNNRSAGRGLVEDTRFQSNNRRPLNKFEALKIGDEDLRKMRIGGYEIDLNENRVEALKVIALPKAKLPEIFKDEDLTYFTHFFSGLSEVFTEGEFKAIKGEMLEEDDSYPIVFTKLSGLMNEGYKQTDTEAMILVKNALESTFKQENPKINRYGMPIEDYHPMLTVKTNIWGFEYVEEGMRLDESELRIFIKQNLNEYERLWWNTFKMTKVPFFASPNSNRSSNRSNSSSSEMSSLNIGSLSDDQMSMSSRRSHRRKSRSSSDKQESVKGTKAIELFRKSR